MKKPLAYSLLLASALGLAACDKPSDEKAAQPANPPATTQPEATPPTQPAPAPAAPSTAPGETTSPAAPQGGTQQ